MKFLWLVLRVLLSDAQFPVSKFRRITSYCRIAMKRIAVRWFNLHPRDEHLFGKTIAIGDYASFVGLYEEIFLGFEYHFQSSTSAPVIVDGGANIGMATLFFAMLYPQAHIISIEPSRSSYLSLQKNIQCNGLTHVTSHNYALDIDSGRNVSLFSERDASLMASIHHERNRSLAKSEIVETAALSDYIQGDIELLKLDIEGNEFAVIEDLLLRDKWRFVQQAIIEYHHHIAPGDDRLGPFLKILEDAGFRYQIHVTYRPPFKKDQFQDILIYAYR